MKIGCFVIIHLAQPREKMWGRIQTLNQAGVTLRGIDVVNVERYRYQISADNPEVFPQTVFYPMHRVIKIEADESAGGVPSIIGNITSTGQVSAEEVFQE